MNRFRIPFFAAVALIVATAFPALAQDTLTRKDLDARLDLALYEVSRIGTELFNNAANEEGCYRIYEGALRTALPLLDHRAELKARVAAALKKAETERSPRRSFVLRDALEDVRKTVRPASAAVPTTRTLWDRLGGEAVVKKVVHDFVAATAKDPKVNVDRGGKYKIDVPKLERLLVEQISAVSGGPLKYTGRDMKTTHAGMKITEAEFNAAAGHLIDTLKANKVGQKDIDELVSIIASTKKDIVEVPATPLPPPAKTLWERLGGTDAVKAVVHDFVAAAAKDPKVNFDRGGAFKIDVPKLEKLLVEQISSVAGGPQKYTGRDMKTTHAGMKITEAEFNAAAGHLIDALKKHKVGQKEMDELVAIIATTRKDIVEK